MSKTKLSEAAIAGDIFAATNKNNMSEMINDSGYITQTAGETIAGATLPVPVFYGRDTMAVDKWYKSDANDLQRMRFHGFAISTGNDGDNLDVQTQGIVSGFAGLTEGVKYYVQDVVGTIGTTPGTQEILVGIAISATEILIFRGKLRNSGVTSFASTTTTTITVGFRVSRVRIHAICGGALGVAVNSNGGWTHGGTNTCVFLHMNGAATVAGSDNTKAWSVDQTTGASKKHAGVVNNITQTTFDLANTKTSTPDDVYIFWEVEGDI